MAEKQPTKKTWSGSKSRLKTKVKQSEAAVPPKVVMAVKRGKAFGLTVSDVTQHIVEVPPMKPHGYKVAKPKSSNAKSQPYVTGSVKGPIVHGVPGKTEAPSSGQSTPISD